MSLRLPSQAFARPMEGAVDDALSRLRNSLRVQIELTTGCNMRCIY